MEPLLLPKSLKVKRDKKVFGSFLQKQIHHQDLWDQFDVKRLGRITEEDFKRLLNACLAIYVYAQMDEQGRDEDIPSYGILEDCSADLFEDIYPEMDVNYDATIFFSEFQAFGERLVKLASDSKVRQVRASLLTPRKKQQPVSDKKTPVRPLFPPEAGTAGKKKKTIDRTLTPAERHMYLAIQDVIIEESYQRIGQVDYFGTQIISYDSENLSGFSFWLFWGGTFMASKQLWMKMFVIVLIAIFSGLFAHFIINPERTNLDSLPNFLFGLEAVLAIFAGLYLDTMVCRWWTIRKDGIGELTKSIADLVTLVGPFCKESDAVEDNIRNVILRYGLLSHALLYYEAQGYFLPQGFGPSCDMDSASAKEFARRLGEKDPDSEDLAWFDLMERELVTDEEMKHLRNVKRKFGAVWAWLLSYLVHLTEKDVMPFDLFEFSAEIARQGRAAGNLVLTHIETPLPLPYVHLVCIMVNLYQVCFAIVTGIVVAHARDEVHSWKLNPDQTSCSQVLQLFLFCMIYQGVLETVEKMANPLGMDDIDFPQLYIHYQTHQECRGIFESSRLRPWDKAAMDQEKIRKTEALLDVVMPQTRRRSSIFAKKQPGIHDTFLNAISQLSPRKRHSLL